MPVKTKTPKFATEAAMCAYFIARVGDDWVAYPETAGWDILLVRKADGFQIGVEAKLRLGTDVINQALDRNRWKADTPGPDCRAILVPWCDVGGFGAICRHLGITIIRVYPEGVRHWSQSKFDPALPRESSSYFTHQDWEELAPARRLELPDYVPDVAAGASAPLQLTDWKIRAIKIAVTLEKRGFVTRADFKHLGIDHRRWLPRESGWLELRANGTWGAGPHLPHFKRMHPRNYDEIAADSDQWMLKDVPEPTLPLIQSPML